MSARDGLKELQRSMQRFAERCLAGETFTQEAPLIDHVWMDKHQREMEVWHFGDPLSNPRTAVTMVPELVRKRSH